MTIKKWHGALVFILAAACAEPLDTQRRVQVVQTPGEAIYQELCNRVSFADDRLDVAGMRARAVCRDGMAPSPKQGARLMALHAQRDRVIYALDASLADGRSTGTLNLVGALEPLYDNGTVRAAIEAQADALAAFLGAPDAAVAMERMATRRGYVPSAARFGGILSAMRYSGMDALAGDVLPRMAEGRPGHEKWAALLNITQAQFTHDAEALTAKPDGELVALRDFLLAPMNEGDALRAPSQEVADIRERMRVPSARNERVLAVTRDSRGVALVASRDGVLPEPFVDTDVDGLADIDASGAFVDASGDKLFVPTPFPLTATDDGFERDAFGRALHNDGAPLYVYNDLGASVLSRTVQQGAALIEADPAQAVAWAPVLQALLGNPASSVHRFGESTEGAPSITFDGYDVESSPLLDLVQSFSALAAKDVMPMVLDLTQQLMSAGEADLASAANLGWQLHAWSKAPDIAAATLKPNNLLVDDMIEVLTEIARVPGLLDDVMASMATPESVRSGQLFAKQMRHADRVDLDPDNVNGPPIGSFNTPVDRSIADVGENESIFQRIVHLVHDAYKMPICNPELPLGRYTYKPCEMFKIDDGAVFYVQAIAGKARMHMRMTQEDAEDFQGQADQEGLEFMEHMTGLKGFERISFTPGATPEDFAEFVYSVTPQASTRLLFAPSNPNISDPETAQRLAIAHMILGDQILDDGKTFADKHHGTLFAWELEGFFDAVKPLMKAFGDHDAEHLICKLVNTIHLHYATEDSAWTTNNDKNRHDYSHQTGLRKFEPLLAQMLDEGNALGIAGNLTTAATNINVGHGATPYHGNKVMAEMARELLVPERTPGLTFYDGSTSVQKSDGSQLGSRLSPTWVIKSALSAISDSLDALPEDSAAHRLPLTVAKTYLAVDADDRGTYHFRNRDVQALAKVYLGHLRTRLDVHTEAGDLETFSRDWPQSMRDTLAHPMTAAAINLMTELAGDSRATDSVGDFIAYLMGPALGDTLQAAHGALVALTDGNNVTPLLTASAPLFAQHTGLVGRTVELLQAAHPLDEAGAMPALMNALATHDPVLDAAPLTALIDAFAEVNRAQPGLSTALASHDFTRLMADARAFILDETTGLARLLNLTQSRHMAHAENSP